MMVKHAPLLKNEWSRIDRVEDSKCLKALELCAVSYSFHWSNIIPEVTDIALSTVLKSNKMSLFSICCV